MAMQYSATQEDELGELYLSNVDFLKNGVPASIIATAVSTGGVVRPGTWVLMLCLGRCHSWLRSHEGYWVCGTASTLHVSN
jgi:uncharacterized membrane protein YczE